MTWSHVRKPQKFYELNTPPGEPPAATPPVAPPVETVPKVELTSAMLKVTELQGKLDEAVRGGTASTAKITELEAAVANATTLAEQVTKLTADLTARDELLKGFQAKVAEAHKKDLLGRGFTEEALKDYTPEQLEFLTTAVSKQTGAPQTRYDRGSSAGGTTLPERGRDKILEALNAGELARVGQTRN